MTAPRYPAVVVAGAVLLSHAAGDAQAARGRAKADHLSVRLTVTPLIGFAPLRVRVSAVVHDPKQELRCPTYAWRWGDGTTSSEWASCDPFELENLRPTRYAPLPRTHAYGPGEYDLMFTVACPSLGISRSAGKRIYVRG